MTKVVLRVIPLLALMTTCLISHSQGSFTDPYEIVIDPKNSSNNRIESINQIEPGEYFRVTIKGLNLARYQVQINSRDTFSVKPLEFPSFAGLSLDGLDALVSGLNLTTISHIEDTEYSALSQKSGLNMSAAEKSQLKGSTEELETLLKAERDKIITMGDCLSVALNKLNGFLLRSSEIIGASKLRNPAGDCFKVKSYCEEILNIQGILTALTDSKEEISSEADSYSKNLNKDIYKPVFEKFKKLKDESEDLKKAYAALIETAQKGLDVVSGEKGQKLLLSLAESINLLEGPTDYVSLPMQFWGDEGSVKIELTPRNEEDAFESWSTEIHFPDLSRVYAGAGLSFFYSGLYDESYSLKGEVVDTVTNYRLVDEGRRNGEIGSALLFRFGRLINSSRTMGIHGSIGPGLSLSETIRPRLLVGGGASFGKIHSLTVDVGAAIGYSERLSRAYNLEDSYLKVEDPTISVLKLSYMISIGYLFRF